MAKSRRKSDIAGAPAVGDLSMAEQSRRAEHDGNRQQRQARRGPLPKLPVRSLRRGADEVARAEGSLGRSDDVSCGDMWQLTPPTPQSERQRSAHQNRPKGVEQR